jgi:hypothetical protein
MSKQEYYMKQCVLRKSVESGHRHTTSWLPERYSKVGNIVQLKDNDEWVGGWEIISVGDRKITAEECNRKSQEHKKIPTYGKR